MSARAAQWRQSGLAAAALLVAALVLYRDTFASMAATWLRSDTFAHGALVFPICAWLAWRKRAELATLVPHASAAGLCVLALLVALWLCARLADVLVAEQLMLVAMIPGLVWALLGPGALAVLGFPLAFLAFAVPFGEGLIPSLMEFTATFTVRALELTGIPVYREGLHFSIPTGDFEVARACSGIRYLIASLALGTLYAHLTYRTFWRRALFIGLALVVPLFANGARAYLIVMIAYWSDMRLAVGVDHLIYGWLFFGLVMFALFWLGLALREREPAPARGIQVQPAMASVASPASFTSVRSSWWRGLGPEGPFRNAVNPSLGAPGSTSLSRTVRQGPSGPSPRVSAVPLVNDAGSATLVAVIVAAAVLVAAPLAARRLPSMTTPDDAALALPSAASGWSGPLAPALAWHPRYRGAAGERIASYEGDGAVVQLALVSYATQAQGAELINSENVPYDAAWTLLEEERAQAPGGAGGDHGVRATRVRGASGNLLVWHWYAIGTHATGSQAFAKLYQLSAALRGSPARAVLIAVATPEEPDADAAQRRLEDFVRAHAGALVTCADRARLECAG